MTTSKKMLQGAALERERLAVMVNNYKIVCNKSGSDKKTYRCYIKKATVNQLCHDNEVPGCDAGRTHFIMSNYRPQSVAAVFHPIRHPDKPQPF